MDCLGAPVRTKKHLGLLLCDGRGAIPRNAIRWVRQRVVKSYQARWSMSRYDPASALRPGQSLSKGGAQRLLADFGAPPGQPASSVYLRPGEARPFLEGQGAEGREWWERLRLLGRRLLESDTGIAGLRAGPEALVLVPPFPLFRSVLYSGWEPAPLLALLEAEHTVGVVLLRLGRFSVAVYRGSRLLSSKTDSRYVKGRHHAGGTSQKRFERIREGQIHQLYGKTCEAVQGQFAVSPTPLEYVLLGGDKFTLDGFLKACPYLQLWRSVTLGRRLNVRDPKRDTLEQVGGMLWESRVWSIHW